MVSVGIPPMGKPFDSYSQRRITRFANGSKIKSRRSITGVSDLVLFIPTQTHHGLFIELKVKPNKQSAHQKEWEKLVTAMNYAYVVVYSFEDFKLQIEAYIGNT